MPATDAPRIVKTTFRSEGFIELPPLEGEDGPRLLNLFAENKSAWRFDTADGWHAFVLVSNSLIETNVDYRQAEAKAREMALAELAR